MGPSQPTTEPQQVPSYQQVLCHRMGCGGRKRSLTFLISSRHVISGDSPPCTHKNCWFKRAARGRQSNVSMHASYTRSEYLIRPTGHRSGKREAGVIQLTIQHRLSGGFPRPKLQIAGSKWTCLLMRRSGRSVLQL